VSAAEFFRAAFAYDAAYRRGDHTTCDRIAKAGNDRKPRTEQSRQTVDQTERSTS
jgi:hypothetical protein